MGYLRDKYVEGRDDVVEPWALEWEQQDQEYFANDYNYSSQQYQYADRNYQGQGQPNTVAVGQEMNLNQYQQHKQVAQQQFEEQKFQGSNINQV